MEQHITNLISENSQCRMQSIRALQSMMPIDSNTLRSALKNEILLSIVEEAVSPASRFKSEMGSTPMFKCIEDAFKTMRRARLKEPVLIPTQLKNELVSKPFIEVVMEYIGTNNDTKSIHRFTKLLNNLSSLSGELYIRDTLDVSMHKWKATLDENRFKDFLHKYPRLFEHIREFAQHYTTQKNRPVNILIQQIYPKSIVHTGTILSEDDIAAEVKTLRDQIKDYIELTTAITRILNTIVTNFRVELKTDPRLNALLKDSVWTHMEVDDADRFLELFGTTYTNTLKSFDIEDCQSMRKNCDYTPKNKSIIMRLCKLKRPTSIWKMSRFVNVFCAFLESTYLMKPMDQSDIDMWNWTISCDTDICTTIMGKGISKDPSNRKQSQQRQKNGHVFITDLEVLEQKLSMPINPVIPSPWFWSRENLESLHLLSGEETDASCRCPISPNALFATPPYHCAETSYNDADSTSADIIRTTLLDTSWEASTDHNDALERLSCASVGDLEPMNLTGTYSDLLMQNSTERLSPFTRHGPNRILNEQACGRCEQVNKLTRLQSYIQNYRMRVWLQYYAMYFNLFKIDTNGLYAIEAAHDAITSRPDCDVAELKFAGIYISTIAGANLIAKTILDCQLKGEFSQSVVKASATKLFVMCAHPAHGETLVHRYGGEFKRTEKTLKVSRIRFKDASISSFVALHFLLRAHTSVSELHATDTFFPPTGQLLLLPWQAYKHEYHLIDIHEHKYELTLYDSFTEIGHRHAIKDVTTADRHTHVRFRQPSAVKEKMRHLYYLEQRADKLVIANPFLTPLYAACYNYDDIVRLLQVGSVCSTS